MKNIYYKKLKEMLEDNENQVNADCVRFAAENDLISMLARHAPVLLAQSAFAETIINYPFSELEMSTIVNRGGNNLPSAFVEKFFKIATVEHALLAVCAYPAFFKFFDLRMCRIFNAKMWESIMIAKISKNKKRRLAHFLKLEPRTMLCQIVARNPILLDDLKQYANFVPTHTEWIFIVAMEPSSIKLNECQRALDKFALNEWLTGMEQSKTILNEAIRRKLFSDLILADWKSLLLTTNALDHYAFISGVFREFSPDDFIDLLLANEYREVYYDMSMLKEKHWKRLKSTVSNLLGIIAKYNPAFSKNL